MIASIRAVTFGVPLSTIRICCHVSTGPLMARIRLHTARWLTAVFKAVLLLSAVFPVHLGRAHFSRLLLGCLVAMIHTVGLTSATGMSKKLYMPLRTADKRTWLGVGPTTGLVSGSGDMKSAMVDGEIGGKVWA